MRSKSEFEVLVFEKANILSKRKRRYAVYRNAAIGTAAAVTILTAVAVGSLGSFSQSGISMLEMPVENHDSYSAKNNTASDEAAADVMLEDENYESRSVKGIEEVPEFSVDEVTDKVDEDGTAPAETNTAGTAPSSADSIKEEQNYSKEISRYQLYYGLPVLVAYYNDSVTAESDVLCLVEDRDESCAKKVIDTSEAEAFVKEISNLEQVKAHCSSGLDELGSFSVVRKDEAHGVVYVKIYSVTEKYVYVTEKSLSLNGEAEVSYPPARNIERSYYFGMSNGFQQLVLKYK